MVCPSDSGGRELATVKRQVIRGSSQRAYKVVDAADATWLVFVNVVEISLNLEARKKLSWLTAEDSCTEVVDIRGIPGVECIWIVLFVCNLAAEMVCVPTAQKRS